MKSPTDIVLVKWNILTRKYKVGDWSEYEMIFVSRLKWINSVKLEWYYNTYNEVNIMDEKYKVEWNDVESCLLYYYVRLYLMNFDFLYIKDKKKIINKWCYYDVYTWWA